MDAFWFKFKVSLSWLLFKKICRRETFLNLWGFPCLLATGNRLVTSMAYPNKLNKTVSCISFWDTCGTWEVVRIFHVMDRSTPSWFLPQLNGACMAHSIQEELGQNLSRKQSMPLKLPSLKEIVICSLEETISILVFLITFVFWGNLLRKGKEIQLETCLKGTNYIDFFQIGFSPSHRTLNFGHSSQ